MQDLMLVKQKGGSYDQWDLRAVKRRDKLQYGRLLGLAASDEPFTQADIKKSFR